MKKIVKEELNNKEFTKQNDKEFVVGNGSLEVVTSAYKPECIFLKETKDYSFEDKKITGIFVVTQSYTNDEYNPVGAEQDVRCANQLFATLFHFMFNDWFESKNFGKIKGEDFKNLASSNGFLDARHNVRYKMAKKNEPFEIKMEIKYLNVIGGLFYCDVDVKGPMIGTIGYSCPLKTNANKKFMEMMGRDLYTRKM